jgi:regulatory protein
MAARETTTQAPSAYQRALRRLARRDHTVKELREKLQERGHPAEEVEETLLRLRAEGYLDDAGFAARYARSRIESHGLGRNRVRASLRARGVARAAAERGLTEALDEVSEAAVLDTLARRYWRLHGRDEPARRMQKLWVFLVRRGFPASLVGDRVRALWPRFADALEGLEPLDAEELGE